MLFEKGHKKKKMSHQEWALSLGLVFQLAEWQIHFLFYLTILGFLFTNEGVKVILHNKNNEQ